MADLIRPKGTTPGEREWMQCAAELARDWAGCAERDARELVKHVRNLKSHDWTCLTAGQADWETLCRDVLGYDAAFLQEMEDGVAVLEGRGHAGPVTEQEARAASASERAQRAALETTGEVLPFGKSNQHTSDDVVAQIAQPQTRRAKANGVSRRTQQSLDRLARERPDLLARVQAGETSVHRACVEAGITRMPTPLELLKRAWAKASKQERDDFFTWISQEGW